MSGKKKETLCWTCQNACAKCSWSRKFKKVKGWIAEKTIIKGNQDGLVQRIPSYRVIKCPKYIPDSDCSSTRIVSNDEVAKWLNILPRRYYRITTLKEREENKQRYILEHLQKIQKRGTYEL